MPAYACPLIIDSKFFDILMWSMTNPQAIVLPSIHTSSLLSALAAVVVILLVVGKSTLRRPHGLKASTELTYCLLHREHTVYPRGTESRSKNKPLVNPKPQALNPKPLNPERLNPETLNPKPRNPKPLNPFIEPYRSL